MRMRVSAVALASLALGAPAQAIVGGTPDDGALARASVMIVSPTGMCSGVVVDADVVLTAAHCVTGAPDYRVFHRAAAGEPVLIPIAAKAVHPQFEPNAVAARRRSIDLALIRLAERLPPAYGAAEFSAAQPRAGAPIRVGGFGVAREGDARSTGAFRIADLAVVEPHGASAILLWAKGVRTGACTGDSGGPMAADDRVVAVVTWAKGAAAGGCGAISQGVLLAPQRAWIDRTLAAWGRKARWAGGAS